MKVKYSDSIEFRLLQRVNALSDNVLLRKDFEDLAPPRQLSKALKGLVAKKYLVRIGYGVYAKLNYSKQFNKYYLSDGFLDLSRQALTKLGVVWDLSTSEKAYNDKLSTQIPVNSSTVINGRFKRKLTYNNMEFKIERKKATA